MKILASTALALSLALGGLAATALPAAAQVVRGIAVANPQVAVAQSSAFRNAQTQRQTTYKAQLDQAQARRTAIEAQLKPLVDKARADSQAASPNQQALQQQVAQIQQIQQQGQNEINQIIAPVALSEQYVLEQISDQLETAVNQAMQKKNVTVLLDAGTVLKANDAYNLTQDITTELNALIPNAQIVPPAGWQPRAQREAAARAAQQTAPAPAPASR